MHHLAIDPALLVVRVIAGCDVGLVGFFGRHHGDTTVLLKGILRFRVGQLLLLFRAPADIDDSSLGSETIRCKFCS